jgi:DNA-binding NarL/FixJ family response regulator
MAKPDRRNRIIVADSGELFCAQLAQVLGSTDDMLVVAQCASTDLLCESIAAFPGSIVLLGSSLLADPERLRILMDTTGCQGILITEDVLGARARLEEGFRGILPRKVSEQTLIQSVRRVAAGEVWLPVELAGGWWKGASHPGAAASPRVPQNTMHLVLPAPLPFTARLTSNPAGKFGPQSIPPQRKVKRAGA